MILILITNTSNINNYQELIYEILFVLVQLFLLLQSTIIVGDESDNDIYDW